MEIKEKIKEIALSFVGQKEIKGNQGFVDKEFEESLVAVGWELGQAWCAYCAELIWKKAYGTFADMYNVTVLDVLFNASAVATFRAFSKSKDWEVSRDPCIGALAVWQTYKKGKPQWTGHIGVVTEFDGVGFKSVEGNTNTSGGREGIEVGLQSRTYNFNSEQGLRLLGFVLPNKETAPREYHNVSPIRDTNI